MGMAESQSKLDLCYTNLQSLANDYKLKGISVDFFTPDTACVETSRWKLNFFTYRKGKKWYRNGPQSKSKLADARRREFEVAPEKKYHEVFPLVVVFPKEDEYDLGIMVDGESYNMNSLFRKPVDGVGFVENLHQFKNKLKNCYSIYFERKYRDDAKETLGKIFKQNKKTWGTSFVDGELESTVNDKLEYYKTAFAMIGEVWNDDTYSNIMLFELMDDIDLAVMQHLGNSYSPLLLSGLINAFQMLYREIPFVSFPGKSRPQLVANFFQGFIRSEIPVKRNVDIMMLGATNTGKTTLVRHIAPAKDKVTTTHFYDVHFTHMPYTTEEYSQDAGVVIWDFGGQKKFWKREIKNTLPTDLIPELKDRQPQIYVLTYAANDETSIELLEEQINICKPLIGDDNWNHAHKVLVRTKIDKGGKLSDDEMKKLADSLGANTYAQVNAKKDRDSVVNVFRQVIGHQSEKYRFENL
jgi:GTPase SAR1 family protein